MDLGEEEQVERARGGDEQALSELLLRHGPKVRLGLTIPERWRSVLDVDEVMQGAYYKAFLGVRAFEPRGEHAFQRWLSILARNQLRDELKALEARKRGGDLRRVEPTDDDDSLVALYHRVAVAGGTPSRSVGREEIRSSVQNAIGALDEDERRVIELRDLEDLTFDEVAARLGRPATTVRNLHARARQRIADFLETASKFYSGPG